MAKSQGFVFQGHATHFHPLARLVFDQVEKKNIAALFEPQLDLGAAFNTIGIVFEGQAEAVVLYVQELDLGVVGGGLGTY